MVGKIKHVRQKLHQEAVKLDPSSRPEAPLPVLLTEKPPVLFGTQNNPAEVKEEDTAKTTPQFKAQSSFPSGIFSGTKISAEALKQTLKFEQPPELPPPPQKGAEEKKLKSKKEKMKERRDRWLNKISSIKQTRENELAAARRKNTPVVGDLRPLVDALPELSQLLTPSANTLTANSEMSRKKSRKNSRPMKRTEPTDFSQMKQSQKRKLLESETTRFGAAVKSLSAKANPLLDIEEVLRKKMRQEEEGQS
ncbi:ribosome biogenesis protein SLX9 homolog isoform X2 [Eucyclogobius newberryi]|uniref:ribosome biogenesis protein SLX9 homolog isoform X2 n=1 Tax=Eucyclogobius newberryi TaxID=166745 RepID=UPI003B58E0FB